MINFVTQSAYFFLKKNFWDFIYYQIYYFEHIINLAVQSFLFSNSIDDSDKDSNNKEKKLKKHKKNLLKNKIL